MNIGVQPTFAIPTLLARDGPDPGLRLFIPAPGALDLRFLPKMSWASASCLRRWRSVVTSVIEYLIKQAQRVSKPSYLHWWSRWSRPRLYLAPLSSCLVSYEGLVLLSGINNVNLLDEMTDNRKGMYKELQVAARCVRERWKDSNRKETRWM